MKLGTIIKTFAVSAFMMLSAMPASAQDLLARQAPVDRKMKAVDTMALRILEREEGSAAIAQLYGEWNNKYAHRATLLPDSFKIDLRHFCMPTTSRVLTSSFGPRWGRQHKGLDIKVYHGDTIRAAFDGKIRVVNYEANGYGNYVVIRHNNGLETIYGHMSKHLVAENQIVKAGTPVGLGGTTGRSTGTHLHFETRLCGVALNPALFFDFRNQDITGDFYTFRRSTMASESAKATAARGQKVSSYTKEEVYGGRPSTSTSPTSSTTTSRRDEEVSGVTFTNNHRTVRHTVETGETIFSISRKYNVSVEELQRLNGLGTSTRVRVGQILKCS